MNDRTITVFHSVSVVVHECYSCGVIYGITQRMHNERLEDGGAWYCPNGHRTVFKEPKLASMQRDLNRANQQIARAEDERREAEKREAAAKAEVRRLKTRIGAGICPCCNRTFSQLAKHMRSKHPDVPFVTAKKGKFNA